MSIRRRTGQVNYGRSRDVTSLRGYIDGLILSNDDASPGDDINIAAGVCRDTTDASTFSITDLTKQIDVVWTAGDDAGGRASGVAYAAGFYAVIVIANPSTLDVDAGFDTDPDGANLIADHSGSGGGDASGYTLYRRIGWVLVNATPKIVGFTQKGDTFIYDDPALDFDIDISGTTASTLAVNVPPDCWGLVNGAAKDSWAVIGGNHDVIYVSSTYNNDEAPSTTGAPFATIEEGVDPIQFWVFTDASSEIRIRGDDFTGPPDDCGVRGSTLMYLDTRGRDA